MENQWRLHGFTQTEGVKIQQMFKKFFLSLKVSTFLRMEIVPLVIASIRDACLIYNLLKNLNLFR